MHTLPLYLYLYNALFVTYIWNEWSICDPFQKIGVFGPHELKHKSSQTNAFKIDTCHFLARYSALLVCGNEWYAQCQDNVSNWGIRLQFCWPGSPVVQHYKVKMNAHGHKSVSVIIGPQMLRDIKYKQTIYTYTSIQHGLIQLNEVWCSAVFGRLKVWWFIYTYITKIRECTHTGGRHQRFQLICTCIKGVWSQLSWLERRVCDPLDRGTNPCHNDNIQLCCNPCHCFV